ncbi:MAG TPA: universal stress protein [Gammaproteobacteria bacterium]|nr:universal stress protein [Gammaproteobacteria bacterium]
MPTSQKSAPPFIESVVHATDFSAASERAFAHALAVALFRRASLTLLHVGKDPGTDWSAFPAVRKTLERWNLLEPGSSQADVLAKVGVQVSKIAIGGLSPSLAITRYLDEFPSDLLVVATEGRDGVARWLHGSVAEAAARWSRTMTLFVPADAQRSIVAVSDGNLTLRSVLIPVDHTPDPSASIEFARRVAELAGGDGGVTITLLHVGADAPPPRVRAEDGANWRFERVTRAGDPVTEILAVADAVRAELIVMPTEGRVGALDALRGSTTERVLRRAPCPLLAVPADRETGAENG